MPYIEKVMSRLNIPGAILLIAGSVAVVAAGSIVQRIPTEKKEKASLVIKAAGFVCSLIGALILLDLIG